MVSVFLTIPYATTLEPTSILIHKKLPVREQMYGHQGGKVAGEDGGVMNREIGIDIYTVICIKWMTNKNLLYKK